MKKKKKTFFCFFNCSKINFEMKKKFNSYPILITIDYGFLSTYILISPVEDKKSKQFFNFQKNMRNFKKIDFLSSKSEKNFQFLVFFRQSGKKKQFQYRSNFFHNRSNFFHKRHIIKIHLQRSMLLSWEVSR